MQKKHIQRKRLQYEEALKVAAKEDVSFFGQCTKFRERSTEPAPIDRAIQFLFLKENNVDRKLALQFGSRRLCKIDSTRQYDGPANFRVMKTSKQLLGSINGWQNGTADVRFNLGSGFTNMQDRHENSFTLKCHTDQRVMTSERDRISMQKYEFSKFNSQRLTQELCKLKAENTFKNIQYQQIADLTKQSLFQPFEKQSTPIQFYEDSVNEHDPKTLDDSSTQRTRAVTNFHEKKQALISQKTISEHRIGQNKQAYLKLFKQLKSDTQLIKRKLNAKKSLQNESKSRRISQLSFFFNLTNKQRLNSNTSISNSQWNYNQQQSCRQEETFEQKLENFVKQRMLLQNKQAQCSTVDYSNLHQKLNQYEQIKQQEFKRIQKVRLISQR
ncbi:unnamed protein product (macronuclear) [Paramecium tetraurelia]|uniref:Uncharacterized protein n=1 Tax=Paramecium tetraurelia TaxID=5888 RepID=A0DE24_PARTE|nr:uncharacterized protein GSPATT00016133001 [Paramecium tetraurelia]CAK81291.1 unnamed protein product [Paramecium tetraurelia]|eukprot:XP_001448688.1 hypothetical protein (macronuclear) [Paramecium tetraurelia strain d4-2]